MTQRQYSETAATGASVPVLQQLESTLSVVHSSAAARKRSKSELERALRVSNADTTNARNEASAALQKVSSLSQKNKLLTAIVENAKAETRAARGQAK